MMDADYLDKCLDTSAGVKVYKFGCTLIYNFDNHSAVIKSKFMKKIKKFAKSLKENLFIMLYQGNKDSSG
jgi:hypothetical protein